MKTFLKKLFKPYARIAELEAAVTALNALVKQYDELIIDNGVALDFIQSACINELARQSERQDHTSHLLKSVLGQSGCTVTMSHEFMDSFEDSEFVVYYENTDDELTLSLLSPEEAAEKDKYYEALRAEQEGQETNANDEEAV